MKISPSINWPNNLPYIETQRLILRPVTHEDIKDYQQLFADSLATSNYLGGPRKPEDTEKRVLQWVDRWQKHPFSAFCIHLKTQDLAKSVFVGHVVLGHGDYENNPENGWSEAALLLEPKCWNSRHATAIEGSLKFEGLGSEVVEAIAKYAQELFNRQALVPVDVLIDQREEVEQLLLDKKIQRVLRNESGQIAAALLPFKEVRLTVKEENTAMLEIVKKLATAHFALVNKKVGDSTRLLWTFKLENG